VAGPRVVLGFKRDVYYVATAATVMPLAYNLEAHLTSDFHGYHGARDVAPQQQLADDEHEKRCGGGAGKNPQPAPPCSAEPFP
jgi:hypothetical protein